MEEYQLYLLMQEKEQPTDYSLSDAHKKIIDCRVKEADESKEPGLSWEEVKAELKKQMNNLSIRPLVIILNQKPQTGEFGNYN